MNIVVGPTGGIIKGSVMDCAVKPLERALKDYDNRLYLIWNPAKKGKLGVWELRRRDEYKSIVDWCEFEGNCYTRLEYAENNFVNHILDLPVLSYQVLNRLKEMDTWNKGYGIANIAEQSERNFDHYVAAQTEKNRADLKDNLRQNKKSWKKLQEMFRDGTNLGDVAQHWK